MLKTAANATSTTLSASCARSFTFPVSGVEARTMQTFCGKCCRNSFLINTASVLVAFSLGVVASFSGVVLASCHPALH